MKFIFCPVCQKKITPSIFQGKEKESGKKIKCDRCGTEFTIFDKE